MRSNRKIHKVLMSPDVVEKLSGMKSNFVWELFAISEDGNEMYFEFSDQPRECSVLPEARQFAEELKQLLTQLSSDNRPVRFIITLDKHGQFNATETDRGLGKWA
jgi:hypothetical protein